VRGLEAMNGGTRITLERLAEPATVLRALLERGVAVSGFTPLIPPLEDIFVQVVETGAGLDQGKSGPPTVDLMHMEGGAR
jgi:hypothetical protein